MIHIVLVEPRIPQNSGNIGRLCVALGARLHLVYPLGFSIDEKSLKRAGMDYWKDLDLAEWKDLAEFWSSNPIDSSHFLLTTKADKLYYDAKFRDEVFLYFGREDAGLPNELIESHREQAYKIPMDAKARSINLATSVGIVAYEAYRQMR